MKLIILLILIFLMSGCNNSAESDDYLSAGKATVKIDNRYFSGSAEVFSKILTDHRYEVIQLELPDSISIEILADEFQTVRYKWNSHVPGPGIGPAIIFMLKYNFYGGTLYNPVSGVLHIQEITTGQINGTFDLKVHDAAASSFNSGTFKYIEGKFRALGEVLLVQ